MTDMELAELERVVNSLDTIVRRGAWQADPGLTACVMEFREIIAALRRGPERIDAKMADLIVDTTWRKAVGQCVADVCGLDGKPLGKRCDRLFISRERFDEHIAPLIRQCERPPSGEMVMVPTEKMLDAGIAAWFGGRGSESFSTRMTAAYRAMLSAAEAEVRKPCPLCGRTDPHQHTSSPLGIS